MANIQIRGNRAYLAEDHLNEEGRQVRRYIRALSPEELEEYKKSRLISKAMVPVTCCNPRCNRTILMPRDQKQKFFTTYPLRYSKFTLPYCSRECQEQHTAELSGLIGKAPDC